MSVRDSTGRAQASTFAAILLLAFALRVVGIHWGLPDELALGDPPFHPDERAVHSRGGTLYSRPDAVTFG